MENFGYLFIALIITLIGMMFVYFGIKLSRES
jgi:hypothetical protein